MKQIIVALMFILAGIQAAFSATYNLNVSGNDPVPAGPSFTPDPKVWYRVAGGAWTLIPASVTAQVLSASAQITANPGDLVEAKAQSCNAIDSTCAPESDPVPAYAPSDAQPYTGISITVTKP